MNLLEEKINNFKLKLDSNKDSISGEKYAEYKERLEKGSLFLWKGQGLEDLA